MLTAEKPANEQSNPARAKRAWRPWYRMAVLPICPTCNVPCTAEGTFKTPDGTVIQRRYCPVCRHPIKTVCSDIK